jgi:hypothetical protein
MPNTPSSITLLLPGFRKDRVVSVRAELLPGFGSQALSHGDDNLGNVLLTMVTIAATEWVRSTDVGKVAYAAAGGDVTIAELAKHLDDPELRFLLGQRCVGRLAVTVQDSDIADHDWEVDTALVLKVVNVPGEG